MPGPPGTCLRTGAGRTHAPATEKTEEHPALRAGQATANPKAPLRGAAQRRPRALRGDMPTKQNRHNSQREIDRILRELGETARPFLARLDRDYVPVSPWTAIRRAKARRRIMEAENAFHTALNQGASPVPPALDPARVQCIRHLYQSGIGPAEIARRTRVTVKTVVRRTADLPRTREPYQPLNAETVTELYTLLDTGNSANAAAKELGISPTTAIRYRDKRTASPS